MVARTRAQELNETIRYAAWTVFRARTDDGRLPEDGRDAVAEEADAKDEDGARIGHRD